MAKCFYMNDNSSKKPARLPPAGGTFLHHQLFSALKHQILTGQLREGERLPSQDELCLRYEVSRITVRRALADLQREDLVYSNRGGGTVVQPLGNSRARTVSMDFLEGLRRVAAETQTRVVSIARQVPPGYIGALLKLGDGVEAIRVVRVNYKAEVNLTCMDGWAPLEYEGRLTPQRLVNVPILEAMLGPGERVGAVLQEVTAERADPDTSATLRVELGAPILRLNRLIHKERHVPMLYQQMRVTPDRTQLLMRFSGSGLNTLETGYLLHEALRQD
jgi:GntR family transcriptional regulator